MKHRFLLDENILHHGIKGVDRNDNPDSTATSLLRLIAKNCHRIVLNPELLDRYNIQLKKLQRERAPALEPAFFLRELLHKSEKRTVEYTDPPSIPAGIAIPNEDIPVVRAALVSQPLFVTADEELSESIKRQPALGLQVLSAKEAIPLARET